MVMYVTAVQLDLDVHTGRQLELQQGIDGLVVGIDDVEDALVGPGLVLVARILVGMRGDEDGVTLDLGRQGDGAAHLRAGPLRRFDALAGRAINQAMIERLEPNPDLLVRHVCVS